MLSSQGIITASDGQGDFHSERSGPVLSPHNKACAAVFRSPGNLSSRKYEIAMPWLLLRAKDTAYRTAFLVRARKSLKRPSWRKEASQVVQIWGEEQESNLPSLCSQKPRQLACQLEFNLHTFILVPGYLYPTCPMSHPSFVQCFSKEGSREVLV